MALHKQPPTDAKLLAASHHDADAFGQLYERYAVAIHRYLRRCTGDGDVAQDLTAETFAQAWLARKRFRDEANGSAAPWLYTIARNVLLMSVRKRKIERAGLERLGLLSNPAAVSGTEVEPELSWLDDLDDALDELPAAQREAITLRFTDDLAYNDVAAALNTSPEAARVRVHRALHTLRTRLEHPTPDRGA